MNQKDFNEIQRIAPLLTQEDFNQEVKNYADRGELADLYEQIVADVQGQYFYNCDACDEHITPDLSRKRIKTKVLKKVPQLALFLKNIHSGAEYQVQALSMLRGEQVDFGNISDFKRDLRLRHEERWTRVLREVTGNNEVQGGVSVLGAVSEELLKRAIDIVSQSPDIFQTTQDDTKSYGDFVLMSLPNNLWFSVKSGFSRERLLASGFNNDLVGVGFFEASDEFISSHKIRNLKKAGFLAIYLPDVAVTQQQHENSTTTFTEVQDFYAKEGNVPPLNINGTAFFRKLSTLGDDIKSLLDVELQKRSTLKF
ncbi:hypothetical protein [Shewanella litoralis]|uniref:Uncharacterized protein n=1 Tax=Shewanella litoralis TaxID=2282700 RepID=A0ABQ2RAW6_9GAMM|nr:hypothetical protein [Shewanella litoralis]GGQ22727.1 hypothetical protein GCM10009411_23450 [Shewanella litoralis]